MFGVCFPFNSICTMQTCPDLMNSVGDVDGWEFSSLLGRRCVDGKQIYSWIYTHTHISLIRLTVDVYNCIGKYISKPSSFIKSLCLDDVDCKTFELKISVYMKSEFFCVLKFRVWEMIPQLRWKIQQNNRFLCINIHNLKLIKNSISIHISRPVQYMGGCGWMNRQKPATFSTS